MDIDAATERWFKGTIEYIRLIDLVQVCCLAKVSCLIKLDSDTATGKICLDSGNVIHAESDDAAGEEGFYKLAEWDAGRFETLPLPKDVKVSINRSWEYLLMQAIRLSREKSSGEEGGRSVHGPSHGFSGTLNDIRLTELVQLICLDRIDRTVEVRSEAFTGTIHFRDGQVRHARTGGLKGQEAFLKILGACGGNFSTLVCSGEGEVSIDVPWEHLLIESMRFLDEVSGVIDEEKAEKRAESLLQKVQKKNAAEKIRLAIAGDKETRSLLIRDSNRMIQVAVISNPRITESEVAAIACSRNVDEEVLRKIATDKEWIRLYPVRLALVTNPKTPIAISRKLVTTLNLKDLKNISRSKSIPTVVAHEAVRYIPK